jgi:RecB family exonuclease
MPSELAYVPAAVPEGAKFKISPSSFSKFIEKPYLWYQDNLTDAEGFTYNTSTVLGTIVHYCAEKVAKHEEVNVKDIEAYIDEHEANETFDPEDVRANYLNMAETLVNDYVLSNDFLEAETQHCAEIKDGYYAAGTLDALQGTVDDCMVVDYKTYSSKTKPRAIPAYYKYQLLVYAYILQKEGYNPTRVRLVYINRNIDGDISEKTGKQLKCYPPETTVLTESITQDDIDFIKSMLELCVDTVEFHKNHPELAHIIWHDPRLKPE